jgi:hypothetical protein
MKAKTKTLPLFASGREAIKIFAIDVQSLEK